MEHPLSMLSPPTRTGASWGSPYPAVLPGERITDPLRAYLRSGGAAGMNAVGSKPLTGKCP
ncbi:hypothetical protein GTY40_27340 [Streptomyces sp. SID8359]|uniref:hypothetical protein n=1 Tax=unclassified Streptomyces TaxID=2593676 RepID=UPI00048FD5BF|nr:MULTISPECIES: hypothetical protein [unclassified Streptomyces]MYT94727.1 hypothetical protein [Streptomyces sp. SID8359]